MAVPGLAQLAGIWQTTPAIERRPLATPPTPAVADWAAFAPGLEAYLADHMGLRPTLSYALRRLRYLAGAPVHPWVVPGKDGWLFFNGADEIEQYVGMRPLDPARIQLIVAELARYAGAMKARGIPFVFVLAPNKTSIYPEYLPAGIGGRGTLPGDQLMAALAGRPDIPAIDARRILLNYKQAGRLFYQTDTHWNDLGAFFVLQATLAKAGLGRDRLHPMGDYRLELRPAPDMDMFQLMNVGHHVEADVPTMTPKFPTGVHMQIFPADAPINYITSSPPPAHGTAVVVGDSFSGEFLKFLPYGFARVVQIPRPLDDHLALIEDQKPDLVILETAERNVQYWYPH
jgi:hypothetical protein